MKRNASYKTTDFNKEFEAENMHTTSFFPNEKFRKTSNAKDESGDDSMVRVLIKEHKLNIQLDDIVQEDNEISSNFHKLLCSLTRMVFYTVCKFCRS